MFYNYVNTNNLYAKVEMGHTALCNLSTIDIFYGYVSGDIDKLDNIVKGTP